jgi:hypothetical protein
VPERPEERFERLIGEIESRSTLRLAMGALSALVLIPSAAWIVLLSLSPLAGHWKFFPLFSFVLFWASVAATAVYAAGKIGASSRSIDSLAAELGKLDGRGTLFTSAREFAAGGGRVEKYSPYLVRETIRRATDRLGAIDPLPLLVSRGRPALTAAALAVSIMLLAQVLLDGDGSSKLLGYLSDPGKSLGGRRGANLITQTAVLAVLSGDDIEVGAVRGGSGAGPVRIVWSAVPGIWQGADVAAGDAAGLELFHHRFTAVREDFVYAFESGGRRSAEGKVTVIRRPVINRVDGELIYPAYTHAKPETVLAVTGRITALEGTVVRLRGWTSKEISEGVLSFSSGGRSELEPIEGGFRGEFRIERSDTACLHVTDPGGLASENPLRYTITAVADDPPSIEILLPEDGAAMDRSQLVDLLFRAADDFGLLDLSVHFMKEGSGSGFRRVPLPVSGGGHPSRIERSWRWSLEAERILPGDRILYYMEARDNKRPGGPNRTRTPVRSLAVPSLSQLFAESRRRETIQREGMDEILEESREIRKRLRELSEDIRADGEMNWNNRSEARELVDKQRELQENIREAADKLDETLENLEANRMTSMEIGRKLERIQELLQRIESEDLMSSIEKLREMMERISPEELASEMKDLEVSSEELARRLDRTVELLQRMLDEQRMEEMMMRMEEMIEKQGSLRDSTAAGMDDLSEGQENLGDEFARFEEDLGEFASRTDSLRGGELREASAQAAGSNIDSLMYRAAGDLERGEMEEAGGSQEEALSRMLSLYSRLGQCQMGMSVFPDREAVEALEKAALDLIDLSRLQEEYASEVSPSGASADTRRMTGGQLELRDAARQITDDLFETSTRSLRISREVFARLGLALSGMEAVMDDIEKNRLAEAAAGAAAVPEQLNLAAIEILASSSSSCGSSGGAQGAMQQLTENQMGIDQMLRKLLGGSEAGFSMEDRASMRRLAAEQRKLEQILSQILEESGGGEGMLGRLDDIGSEMEEIAGSLEEGSLDRELIDREERILSRLLESQRSLNRRDYSRRRTSRTAGDVTANEPGPRTPGEEREIILEMIRRGMREKGPAEFEELNRLYFRALSRKVRGAR